MTRFSILLLALMVSLPAFAKKYEGVTLPDSVELGGVKLVLNGMGLREKFFVDVYVAGLYLPARTTSARTAINDDVAKRIDMVMKRDIDREKLAETMEESISKSGSAKVSAKGKTLAGWMEDVSEGDHIILDYVPGKGTTVSVKGKAKGTIDGVGFMKALFGLYLGRNPPTEDLRDGLLGR